MRFIKAILNNRLFFLLLWMHIGLEAVPAVDWGYYANVPLLMIGMLMGCYYLEWINKSKERWREQK